MEIKIDDATMNPICLRCDYQLVVLPADFSVRLYYCLNEVCNRFNVVVADGRYGQ